jgi:hypothetical protein
MKTLRHVGLLACLAVLAACGKDKPAGTATALTEPQLRAFLEQVESASYTEREDEVLGAALADDVRIVWRTPGEPDEAMDKDEYLEDPEGLDSHDYSYKVDAIDVAADGKSATAKVAATETYSFEGVKYASDYEQLYRIELRDGAPLVVALEGNETSFSVDGKKIF